MADQPFADQVIVERFSELPEHWQTRILRMLGVTSLDELNTVDERRKTVAARQITAFLLRPSRPVPPGA